VPRFVFLATKITSEAAEPIIGIQFIEEFLPVTYQADNEPKYICHLCVVRGEITTFFAHIIGI
jgi:hypothetical protein